MISHASWPPRAGDLIATAYVLTIEDPHRFRKSRDAGIYSTRREADLVMTSTGKMGTGPE
jgi:hypothetical protein